MQTLKNRLRNIIIRLFNQLPSRKLTEVAMIHTNLIWIGTYMKKTCQPIKQGMISLNLLELFVHYFQAFMVAHCILVITRLFITQILL